MTGQSAGFTLIELCVVIVIVGLVMAIALPQFLPLLIFSELEGEARRLAHYGSGIIAEAALFGTDLTVYFDLDAQEYYAIQLVQPVGDGDSEESVDHLGMFSQMRASGNLSSQDMSDVLSGKTPGDRHLAGEIPEDFDAEAADAQMSDQFTSRHHQLIYKRAQNVKHDAGFLSEIGPLFEKEFTLSWAEPYEEELIDPILGRHRMPEGIRLDAVRIEGSAVSRGVAEILVSPLGLDEHITLYLRNEDDDYFTVTWNPLTGRGLAQSGRWD